MSDKIQNGEQIKYFLQGEKHITVPFSLHCGTNEYICTSVLRLLPAKRLVVDARCAGQHVVIKLFASAQKGLREFNRENQGYKLVSDAGIKTPEMLFSIDDMTGCYAVIYTFVENAKTFSLNDGNNFTTKILKFLAKSHRYGIYQDDIHTANILTVDDELYLIDLGSVICEQENIELSKRLSLSNLAKFISQFTLTEQRGLLKYLEVYYQERLWVLNQVENKFFLKLVNKAWKKRKAHYIKKCFRNCTMTSYGKSFTQEFAFKTGFISEFPEAFFKDIDQLMLSGNVIKAGNSATVTAVKINGKKIVIKRYNIKSIWHFLKRCLRPSRASVSWKNANLLALIGIQTPKPLGFIEYRRGVFRSKAYFFSEYIEAEDLMDVYLRREPSKDELSQIKNIFSLLKKSQISHGDLKASNLLLNSDGEILMIDLDAMQEHSSFQTFQKAYNKDKGRFLRNWKDLRIKKIFQSVFN